MKVKETGSKDTTRKLLFRLTDGQMVETVLIPASPALYGEPPNVGRSASQARSAAPTGASSARADLTGLKRNLTAGEIVAQFLAVEELSGEKINNIVFMGMGEPFANYGNFMRAIRILNAPWAIGIGARNMTVSTSGLVRAKSGNSPINHYKFGWPFRSTPPPMTVRSKIMPVNRKYPLRELMEACQYYCTRKNQPLTFEYILIRGLNDTEDQALAACTMRAACGPRLTLFPTTLVKGLDWERPSEAVQEGFLGILKSHRVAATLRREKGHDIAAACGQLRSKKSGYRSKE